MTDRIALGLALLIFGFLLADAVLFGWEMSLFLIKKTVDLVDYVAFWR